jgi:hypothetical protein
LEGFGGERYKVVLLHRRSDPLRIDAIGSDVPAWQSSSRTWSSTSIADLALITIAAAKGVSPDPIGSSVSVFKIKYNPGLLCAKDAYMRSP